MLLRHIPVISLLATFTLVAGWTTISRGQQAWTQWGGDNGRNFSVVDTELPAEPKPELLWRRDLGGGYSGILCQAGRLYTMFRDGNDEIVTCLDADSGETVWEYRYNATIPEAADTNFGEGPNSTPIIIGNRIVTVGFIGDMHCLDLQSGEVVWRTSLWKDHDATPLGFGFSASPLHYRGKIILPIGGAGQTIKAFRVQDGTVAWSALDYPNSYGTPLLITVDGLDHLIVSLTESVIGVDPEDGSECWSFPLKNQWDTHAFVPVWDERNQLLFVSSFQQSHGLSLTRQEDRVGYDVAWSIAKTGIGFTNAVRVKDVIYGTTGGTRSPLITAFDLNQGKVLWKERGFGISNMLSVDGRLLFLDEKGTLVIAEPDAGSLNVVVEQKVLDSDKGWTFPTLVGQTLYVRNQKQVAAWRLK
jgi:outer membrane protein assembly factor BamB